MVAVGIWYAPPVHYSCGTIAFNLHELYLRLSACVHMDSMLSCKEKYCKNQLLTLRYIYARWNKGGPAVHLHPRILAPAAVS